MYYRDDKPETEMLAELLDEAATYVDVGYTFLKVKVGKNLEFDKELIAQFRNRFPKTKIAADSNHAYNYKEAIAIGRVLDANDYCWFEEPLSPENYADMARLRDALSVPIASGECEANALWLRALCQCAESRYFSTRYRLLWRYY